MAVLTWGKPELFIAKLNADDEPVASLNPYNGLSEIWHHIDTPQENSTQLTTNDGETREAKEEGGALVDYKATKSTHSLAFTLFVKKNIPQPFDDEDGVIAGNYALRLIPEDSECQGILVEKAALRVSTTYSSQDGTLKNYTLTPLKPREGNTIKPYYAQGLSADGLAPNPETGNPVVILDATDGSETVTIVTTSADNVPTLTVAVDAEATWLHATVSDDEVAVTADDNTGEERTGRITVSSATHGVLTIEVTQAAGAGE